MHFKIAALAGLVAVLAVASQADALGGDSSRRNGTVTLNSDGSFSGSGVQGQLNSDGTFSGQVVTATEPVAALAVGLGLLGARYLRRRR
ncbi:MAG: hypothetical protein ACREJG_03910 [Candidatus Rokuibacteriota bacterium]